MLVSERKIATPEEDEVIIGEDSIMDKGVGGVIQGNGEVTKVGGGSTGDGVMGNGEYDWSGGGGRLVE